MGFGTIVDHDELIDDNTATEYSESTTLDYVKAINAGHTELDSTFIDLLSRLDVDTVTGVSLDIIGKIVGQPRVVVGPSTELFFGFATLPESNSFGDLDDPSIGGRFRDESEQPDTSRTLIDEEYRKFILAKIFKNNTRSTPEDTITAFKILFDVDPIILEDAIPTTGFARITFTRFLNTSEKSILANPSILPKTLGVSYEFAEVNIPFGFLGAPNVQGFGDLDDFPNLVGGSFPRILTV